MIKYKFSREINSDFTQTLKKRVNNYFKENKVNRNANSQMISKTVSALSLYLIPFAIILFAGITNLFALFALWMIMGFGKSFIGLSIMHDGLHGSYSKNKVVNFFMGNTAVFMGIDPKIWSLQHNVLHHTYTNIEHADDDIAPRFVLRFTPHQPRKWFHRYQHIYALFFYGISTLLWVTVKDFVKLFKYKQKGLIHSNKEFAKDLSFTILRKAFYYSVFLLLPMFILPFSWGTILLMFVVMHLVTGVVVSLIFQPAHVIPTSEFILQEEELIEENFLVHQIITTSNFAMSSKIFSWFVGGLNFQIEHHLFPNICHVHYSKIAGIVKKTAHEFKLPYHSERTFLKAVINHFKLLKELGRYDRVETVKVSSY